jgi:nucleoside-diphosphate-sugar epimerase
MSTAYPDVLIVGCGFTGQRVLRLMQHRGLTVIGFRRTDGLDVNRPDDLDTLRRKVSPVTRVLLSVPTQRGADGGLFERTPDIMQAVAQAQRVVYLSTTGVYGGQSSVDQTTQPAPRTERELLRVQAEAAVLQHPNAMVLRPAAIYGPGRGVHIAMREGRFALPQDDQALTSRIHVADLADHSAAALMSSITGAFPVADEEPSTARAIAAFCAELLGLPMPPVKEPAELPETRRGNRRVDGSAVRLLLALILRYPSYRTGIPASVQEEDLMRAS